MDMGHWIDLIRQKLVHWAVAFVKLLPNMVLAILVFLIFFFAARLMRRFFAGCF